MKRGVLVTRMWYIREVDPQTILYTGLTRDGTFYVEDGEIKYAIKNFRFNESPVIMLNNIEAMGKPGARERLSRTADGRTGFYVLQFVGRGMSLAVARAPHASVLDVLPVVQRAIARKTPFSLVRLGDGEGRLLGFPRLVDKAELDVSLQIWFGRTDFDPATLADLSRQLRAAVVAADVIGLPRASQAELPEYGAVFAALGDLAPSDRPPLLTDAAIHRYFQLGLFIPQPP